jgi:hypothetical protein
LPKDLIEVTLIALTKKSKTTKYSDHRTISLNAHSAKMVAKILRRRIERKIEMYLEKISLDLEKEKEPGMQLRTISERTWLHTLAEGRHHANWIKFIQILKETGIDWREKIDWQIVHGLVFTVRLH